MSKKIVLLVGPSGSGKTTIANILETEYELKVVSSYTTRPMRIPNEKGHIFVTENEFSSLMAREPMCAYTEFAGYKYGVPASMVEKSDIYVIDPAGIKYFQNNYHGTKQSVVVGLMASPDVLRQRMNARGDSPEQIEKRIQNDEVSFANYGELCDHLINVGIRGVCQFSPHEAAELIANTIKEV